MSVALHRTTSRARSDDNWGRSVTLLLVVCALSGAILGLDLASRLVLAVGFLAAAYGLVNPGVGLLGMGVLATTDPVLRYTAFAGGMALPYNTLNYWLVLFCLLHAKRVLQLRQLQSKLHLLLAVVVALGLLWSPNVYPRGLVELLRVAGGFGLIVYFQVFPPSQQRMLLWVAISASAVATIFGLLVYTNPSIAMRFNENLLAMMPLTALFTVFLVIFTKVAKRRELHVLMLLAAANLTFVFFSGSRGAMSTGLVLWLGILLWGFKLPQKIAYGLAAGFVVLALAALSPQFQEFALYRLEFTFDSSRTFAQRTSGRSEIAKAGWEMFIENPLGIGTGGFGKAMTRYYDPNVRYWDGRVVAAESAFVRVLAENGVIGILVLFAYVTSFAWTGFKRRRYGLLPVGLIASSVLAVRFLSAEFSALGAWWFAAGSVFLLYRRSRPPARAFYPLRRTQSGLPIRQSASIQSRQVLNLRPRGSS
jgi:hypothetical protein